MGIVGFNFYATLTFSQIVVNNQVTFSWEGNGVLLAGLYNASLIVQNSTVTSKMTIMAQSDNEGVLVGNFINVACAMTVQNVKLYLNLLNGTATMGVFGYVSAGVTVTAVVQNLTLNVSGLQCFQNNSGTLVKTTWTTVGCT